MANILLYCCVVLVNMEIVYANADILSFSGASGIYIGGGARYTAIALVSGSVISDISWTLNGSTVDQFSDITPMVTIVFDQIGRLQVSNISLTYDNTEVHCTVILDGNNVSCGTAILLRVQGLLGPVEELSTQYNAMDNTVNISWSPPPAILVPEPGLAVTRPERFYCVEILNETTTESRSCNTTADMNGETSITLSNIQCGVNYDITITPYNRLGDGTQTSTVFPDAPHITVPGTPPRPTNVTYVYEVAGLACTCSAAIMDMDIEGSLQCDVNTPTPGSLTITTIDTTRNERFNIAINTTNSRASTSKTVKISTYDLDDLIVTSAADSVVNISLIFVGGTNARGVFIALLFTTGGEIDFSRSVFFILRRGAEASNQLSGLSAGTYTAQAYDVEETGVITSGLPADQEMINVTGPDNPPGGVMNLTSFGVGINCTSNRTMDMRAVSVTCEFEVMTYTGFLVTLLYGGSIMPTTSAKSTMSGSIVTVNGTVEGGEHTVVVYPTSMPSLTIPNMAQPVLREVYDLAGVTTPTIASTTQALTTDTPQEDASTTSSASGSSASTTTSGPVVTGASRNDMGTIIGVVIAIILISIIMAVLIVVVAVLLVRWNRKRKTVSVRRDEAFILAEKDGKRSPSSDTEVDNYHIPPVYATAGPPMIPAHEPLTANGGDNPPPEGAPPPPEGAADLYSVVDKSKPQEQMYETVQLKKPSNKKVEDVHLVEYASLQYIDPTPSEKDSEVPPPVPPHSEEEGPNYK